MATSDSPKRQQSKNAPQGSGQGKPASTIRQAQPAPRSGAPVRPATAKPRRPAVKTQGVPLYFYALLGVLLVVGGYILFSIISGSNQKREGDAPLPAQEIADKGISRGNPNAKVIFVEFGDFQCPGCADFATQVESDFKAKYVDTNQVREVWMNYPLTNIHPKAMKAAEAGMCANEQGKFWEFHDKLYANQDAWVNGDENTLWKSYATQTGIDGDKLMQCMQANKYAAQIQDTMKIGDSEKVQGTPSFLINHILLFGAGPDDLYKTIASEAAR